MRKVWERRIAALVFMVAGMLGLVSCASAVPGTAVAGAPPPPPPAPPKPKPTVLPKVGECVLDDNITPRQCSAAHTVEITAVTEIGQAAGAGYPEQTALLNAEMPDCYAALTGYLGSGEFAVTSLDAWMAWPNKQQWAGGERWQLCGVSEINVDGKGTSRTGSLSGVLAGDGIFNYQICSSVKARDAAVQRVPCNTTHVAETVPGVLKLGEPGQPMPSADAINAQGEPHCKPKIDDYLGIRDGRKDVFYAWRWPSAQQYANGNVYLVCYAEPQTPVTLPLRNVRGGPLPK
ncbi:septum formation family protein [Amycolatopsis nigrescens]|uniref:septum formation family protein n=1 Tax=Amycolatopsis nigrescens TaxID=381445 RepID=UPI0003A99672|nr:septum formation family protein [Amycolatopsis nigrescens]